MSGDTYTCGLCGGTFGKTISDGQAAAESRRVFTPAELEAVDVVCDDCWKLIEPELPRLRAELDQLATAAGLGFDEFMRREARLAE